jgi:hypothetical protein
VPATLVADRIEEILTGLRLAVVTPVTLVADRIEGILTTRRPPVAWPVTLVADRIDRPRCPAVADSRDRGR